MEIVRKRLSTNDLGNSTTRYNVDCDCLQTTSDGGSTWVDNPGIDPRHNPAFQKQPLGGVDARCNAAANMVKWLKDYLDGATFDLCAGAAAFAIATKLLDVIAVLFPPSDFVTLFLEVAGELFDLGCIALEGALTSTQYELLLCVFYCGISVDGTVTATQFTEIMSEVTAKLNTTAALVINLILSTQGEVGLTNAGVIGGQTGDCSGCDCGWCWDIDFTATDGGFTSDTANGSGAVYVPGTGWTNLFDGGNNGTYIKSALLSPTGIFESIEFTYVALISVTSSVIALSLSTAFPVVHVEAGVGNVPTTPLWTGSQEADTVYLQVGNSTMGVNSGTSVISHARFKGSGTNPFGSDNC